MIMRNSSRLLILAVALVSTGVAAADARGFPKTIMLREARAGYYSIKVQYPRFAGSSAVVRKANADLTGLAQRTFADFQNQARDTAKEFGKPIEPSLVRTYEFAPTVSLARPDLISVFFIESTFEGGNHASMLYASESFGLVEGAAKRLYLSDLLRPGMDARSIAGAYVYSRLKSEPRADWIQQGRNSIGQPMTATSPELTKTFVITTAGLTFLIAPYDVGCWASGSFQVKVPWSAFGSDLAPKGPLGTLMRPR